MVPVTIKLFCRRFTGTHKLTCPLVTAARKSRKKPWTGLGSHTTPADGWESIVIWEWNKIPKIAAINTALSRYDTERAPIRINLQTVICMFDACWKSSFLDKTFETPLLFTHLAARQITKSSSLWSCSKKPLSSHLSQAFRTPAGMKKKSIRQTERRGGENVIDWDEDLGCLALLNLSLPLTSSTLCLHLFLPSAWFLLSPRVSFLFAHSKTFLSLYVSVSPAVQTNYHLFSPSKTRRMGGVS